MNKGFGLLGIVAAGLLIAGCAGSEAPTKEQLEAQRSKSQLLDAQAERDVLKPQVADLQKQLEVAKADALAKDKTITKLQNDLVRAGETVTASQEANLKKIGELEKEITLLKAENEQLKAQIKALEGKLAGPAAAPATRPELNK